MACQIFYKTGIERRKRVTYNLTYREKGTSLLVKPHGKKIALRKEKTSPSLWK